MYTILIDEDHSFTHAIKQRIMCRSTGIDTIRFLVNPMYNDLDMTQAIAVLEYVKPISREYSTIKLTPSAELYKNKVEFLFPLNIKQTAEAGELELTINFSHLSKNADGTFAERVRRIGSTSITIHEDIRWSDYIASSDLDNIAQIMLTNQSLLEQQKAYAEMVAYGTPNTLLVKDGKLHIGKDGNVVDGSVGVDVVFPRTIDDDGRDDGIIELGEVIHDDSNQNCDCGCDHENFEELDSYIATPDKSENGNFSEL